MALSWIFTFDFSTALIACVIFLVINLFIQHHRNLKPTLNLAPGPTGWPLLGNLPGLDPKAPYRSLTKLADQYGPVFSLRFGSFPVVVLSSFESVKEAFIKNGDDYDDRPNLPVFEFINGRGIICAHTGLLQRNRRRFALQAMRNLGMGKFRLEEQIADEIDRMIERLNSYQGKPFCPFDDLQKAFSNVICYIAFGKRYDYEDPKFKQMLLNLDRSFKIASFSGIGNFLPIFNYLPFGGMHEMKAIDRYGKAFIGDLINDVSTGYIEYTPRNFIDMYYDHRDKLKKEQEEIAEKLDAEDLFRTVGDLFIAGTETSSTTIKWALIYMMIHPDIQDKVQDEMDDVVGRSRFPSLKDRLSLSYTEATLMEIQRFASITPFSVPRAASVDTQLFGYDIPKGTMILPNLWKILHDESIWKDPHTFDPLRFVDENGGLNRREELIPFVLGRRKCLGEQLALMELFLFLTHLLHRFKFRLPEGAPTPCLQGIMGVTLAPEYYELCAIPRPMS